MDRFGLRVGAAGGWIAFLGIAIGLVAVPMTIAGQPPTLSSTANEVQAYFGHRELAVINALSPLIVVAMIPFGLALRSVLRLGDDRARLFADIGLISLIVAVPLYVVSASLGATLVGESGAAATSFDAIFRLYSVLYDGAADFLEGAWVGAFGVAILMGPGLRWLGWLGIAVGLSRWVKGLAPVVALPDVLALIGGVAFLVWFGWTVVWLTRQSMAARERVVSAPAPAT